MSVEGRGDLRVLAGTPATAGVTFYQGDVASDPGAVTVTATRADGTTFTPVAQVTGEGAEPRTVALSIAETDDLDLLTLSWHSETLGTLTTTVETVGGRLFTLAELRGFRPGPGGGGNQGLDNTDRYPDDALEETRRRIEDGFEAICEASFISRFEVQTLSGYGRKDVLLGKVHTSAIRFVEIRDPGADAYTALTEAELADLDLEPWGGLWRRSAVWPSGNRNIRIGYVHGHARVPGDIRRAGLILAQSQLIEGNVSDRALAMSNDQGVIRMATAGITRGSWYGLPLVDSVLALHLDRVPRVG